MLKNWDEKRYVIVHTNLDTIFAGYLESREGSNVVMEQVRQFTYWTSASLSHLATYGVTNPRECVFPYAIERMNIPGVIALLDCTQAAQQSIEGAYPQYSAIPESYLYGTVVQNDVAVGSTLAAYDASTEIDLGERKSLPKRILDRIRRRGQSEIE